MQKIFELADDVRNSASSDGCEMPLMVVDGEVLFELLDELSKLKKATEGEPAADSGNTAGGKTEVKSAYWASTHYGGDSDGEPEFTIAVDDQRQSNGQMYVDIIGPKYDLEEAQGENLDDIMSLSIEINRLPESKKDMQCVHLHFDNDRLAASFFKDGDKIVMRPEVGVYLQDNVLPSGERVTLIDQHN